LNSKPSSETRSEGFGAAAVRIGLMVAGLTVISPRIHHSLGSERAGGSAIQERRPARLLRSPTLLSAYGGKRTFDLTHRKARATAYALPSDGDEQQLFVHIDGALPPTPRRISSPA